jgi:hypothetical protein
MITTACSNNASAAALEVFARRLPELERGQPGMRSGTLPDSSVQMGRSGIHAQGWRDRGQP